jgi:hypothetical protein
MRDTVVCNRCKKGLDSSVKMRFSTAHKGKEKHETTRLTMRSQPENSLFGVAVRELVRAAVEPATGEGKEESGQHASRPTHDRKEPRRRARVGRGRGRIDWQGGRRLCAGIQRGCVCLLPYHPETAHHSESHSSISEAEKWESGRRAFSNSASSDWNVTRIAQTGAG